MPRVAHMAGLLTAPSWVALFCLLQATPWTAALALPVLALGGLWLLAINALRLDAPTRMDALVVLGLLIGAWSAAVGLNALHSLMLAVPSLVFALIYVLLTRADQSHWRLLHLGILGAACLQMLQLWLGLLLQPVMPAGELLQVLAIPWLVVPNDWVWIACLAPFCVRALGPSRWVCAALLLAIALTALLLQSRLSLLCLALGLWPLLRAENRPSRWAMVVAIGLVSAMLAMLSYKGLNSIGARLQLWQAAFDVWLEHPWLGVGPHNFVLAYSDVMSTTPFDLRLTPWPHSLPLELLAEWGVLGLLIWTLIALSAWRSHRDRVAQLPMIGLILALAPALLLEASLLRTWLWFTLALLLAGCRQQPSLGRH